MKPQRVNPLSRNFRWKFVVIAASMTIVQSANAFPGDPFPVKETFISSLAKAPIAFSNDPQVRTYIERFVTIGKKDTEATLGRALYYFPLIEERLEWYKLPTALKYLPLVESMLRPEVTSPVGAAGIWQIMPITARHFGLVVNENVDERRDFFASTEAAAKLLSLLYEEFDDWHLVLAAYNCGPGKVRQAIRRADSRDYSDIKPFLPLQTRNYLSKFTAMAQVAAFSGYYGLKPQMPEIYAEPRQILHIQEARSIAQLADICGVSPQLIRQYNPAYVGLRLPHRAEGYRLVLPVEVAGQYYAYQGETSLIKETAMAGIKSKAAAQAFAQEPIPVDIPVKRQLSRNTQPHRIPVEDQDVPFTRYYFSRRWQDAA